ncbi:hypothetical protein POTOM_058091 [Populus tomentosa]|uniref:Reverse transcriptase Ty1/copia-type domain-containing protein n=1 Tax=Populus tomentosa TaxID=118781 RepID=A0A8X8BWT3_POPTO|nr:hypothetical protein POTOM_058091 [Populus tomentosa]
MDVVIEPTTLELQPYDQSNIVETSVLQQQSSPLDTSILHESPSTDESQVNLEPPLRILPNRIIRGIPREAIKDPRWKNAMNDEMKSLQRNATLEMIEYLLEKKLMGRQWIFSVKYKVYGDIERFKVRLMAKRYSQTSAMDMDYKPYMLVEGRKAIENPPSQSLDQKLLAEAFQYELEMNFSLEDPIPLFSSSSSFHHSKPVKPQRHIPQRQEMTLDAPNLVDDF